MPGHIDPKREARGGTEIAQQKTTTKYPLSAPMAAGIENLRRLNLITEAKVYFGTAEIEPFSDMTVSGHGPLLKDGMRLNYAAKDDDFRQTSIHEFLVYVDMARRFPKLKQINIHFSPKQWFDETQLVGRDGDYNRLIDGVRQIAGYAARWGIEIVLENNNAYFDGIADDVPADHIDWSDRNQAFGASPEEWFQVCEDVGRPNVALCLDSSHACTYAHTFAEPERREAVVMAFLAKPHLIRHVHWNDNYLFDARGRTDSHELLGKGSLPVELHRAIKCLDATLLLEHFHTIEELEEELEYIDRL